MVDNLGPGTKTNHHSYVMTHCLSGMIKDRDSWTAYGRVTDWDTNGNPVFPLLQYWDGVFRSSETSPLRGSLVRDGSPYAPVYL